ncbi:hypothetical protein [Streptomyces sp. NRRL B-24484]|uniref:hypothetical protein n=1 Tax=Streptomyces sp. NRRL B-24484 TaxID=1463833 RepID=UPI0013315597|nr:hypothetical protein [Streptomyces sp. NRRL B-24484]
MNRPAAMRRLSYVVPASWWGRGYVAAAAVAVAVEPSVPGARAVAQVLTAPAWLVLPVARPLFAVLPGAVSAVAPALLQLGGALASVAVFSALARRARIGRSVHPAAR